MEADPGEEIEGEVALQLTLVVDRWRIFAHPQFLDQIEKLTAAVTRAKAKAPAALGELVFATIPSDRARGEYRQGGAPAAGRNHWFRRQDHHIRLGGPRGYAAHIWL